MLSETLNISTFTMMPIIGDLSVNKLFIAQTSTWVYALDVNATDYQILEYNVTSNDFAIDPLNILDQVVSQDLFFLPTTEIIDMAIIDVSEAENDYLEFEMIIVTDNTAIYKTNILFNNSDNETARPFNDYDITGVYGNYGSNIINNRVEVFGDYFAVSYWNQT